MRGCFTFQIHSSTSYHVDSCSEEGSVSPRLSLLVIVIFATGSQGSDLTIHWVPSRRKKLKVRVVETSLLLSRIFSLNLVVY